MRRPRGKEKAVLPFAFIYWILMNNKYQHYNTLYHILIISVALLTELAQKLKLVELTLTDAALHRL